VSVHDGVGLRQLGRDWGVGGDAVLGLGCERLARFVVSPWGEDVGDELSRLDCKTVIKSSRESLPGGPGVARLVPVDGIDVACDDDMEPTGQHVSSLVWNSVAVNVKPDEKLSVANGLVCEIVENDDGLGVVAVVPTVRGNSEVLVVVVELAGFAVFTGPCRLAASRGSMQNDADARECLGTLRFAVKIAGPDDAVGILDEGLHALFVDSGQAGTGGDESCDRGEVGAVA